MTSRDGERLARRGGLTAVVLVVAVTGAVGMELLGAFVREANAVRIALVEVSAAVNRQSALEWQAVATGGAEDEVWEALETNDAAIAEAADRLRPTAANDQELAGFLRVVEDYRAAVTSMTDFLRAGNVERAEATDEETVDPLFDRLHGTAHDLVAAYSSRADVVGLAGRVGTVGLLSGRP